MIRAVLFDKDGTLVNFEQTWLPVANRVVESLLQRYDREEPQIAREMLEAIGVFDVRIDPEGSMAQGTNRDVALDFLPVLRKHTMIPDDEQFVTQSTALFDQIAAELPVVPTEEGLPRFFETLRQRGLIIGLATADSDGSARQGLRRLGLASYFDFIGADNGCWAPKPAPEMMAVFCRQYGLDPQDVAMVGDTPTDLRFGEGAGAGFLVGVLCGTGSREDLEPLADVIIMNISDIIDERGALIWNERGV